MLHRFFEAKPHPITGDLLKPTERLSWWVMRLYRQWRIFLIFRVFFWIWVFERGWFHDPNLVYLLLLWSDMAIIMEQVMGLSMFPQMIRDSQIMRQELQELKTMHQELHDKLDTT